MESCHELSTQCYGPASINHKPRKHDVDLLRVCQCECADSKPISQITSSGVWLNWTRASVRLKACVYFKSRTGRSYDHLRIVLTA